MAHNFSFDLSGPVGTGGDSERDPTGDAQAPSSAATEREMQAKYRGESVDDGDLGSLEDEPREPHRSFYHPYG